MKQITKDQAIALLTIMHGKVDEAGRDLAHLAHQARIGDVTPWLGPCGTKIGAKMVGCVVRYHITGYISADVTKALAMADAKLGKIPPHKLNLATYLVAFGGHEGDNYISILYIDARSEEEAVRIALLYGSVWAPRCVEFSDPTVAHMVRDARLIYGALPRADVGGGLT